MSQRLRGEIDARQMSMGSTPTGVDWCIKALHPSDPLTEVRGIPDQSAVPSLLMNYQSTYTISPNPAAVGTWSFDMSLLPHPINFAYIDRFDSVVPGGIEIECPNTQIVGATHGDRYKQFVRDVQRWRLAYCSATVYQDGPDLANQGTIVVSQPPVMPKKLQFGRADSAVLYSTVPVSNIYTGEDRPSYTASQSMPNAYFNKSKEGAYVPLKLTETCQDWISDADSVTLPTLSYASTDDVAVLANAGTPQFPHVGLQPLINGVSALSGHRTSPMLNGTWAHVCARNLSIQTSYSIFFRYGVEMQVSPGTSLAPQLKLSPPFDPVALTTYFAIARELKDAYPSDYNTVGKIWDEISKALKVISGPLGMIPGYGTVLSGAISGAAGLGDYIRKSRKASGPTVSAAQKQRLREAPARGRREGPAQSRQKRKAKNKPRNPPGVTVIRLPTVDRSTKPR